MIADEETKCCVEGMIKDVTDTTDRNTDYCQSLIGELKDGGHKDIVQELVRQMGGKVHKSYNANQNLAVSWLKSEPRCQPFMLLTVSELQVSIVVAFDHCWVTTQHAHWHTHPTLHFVGQISRKNWIEDPIQDQ